MYGRPSADHAHIGRLDRDLTIIRHPWITGVLACKTPLHVMAFSSLPIAAALCFLIDPARLTVSATVAAGAFGVVYWSLFEYAVHRWLYHTVFKVRWFRNFIESLHLFHHRNLKDTRILNAGPLLVYPLIVSLLAPVAGATGSLTVAAVVGLGLIGSYTVYEFVHYGIHYKPFHSGYMGYIQRYHFFHHEKRWDRNFGNTSHLWDVLLGTYDPAYRSYSMSREVRDTFIVRDKSS